MNDVSFNARTASLFRECAELLRQQQANPFRVNAYLRAAATLENLQTDAREILDVRGREGLLELPAIGRGLTAAIEEIARTGKLAQLERLRGEMTPEVLFTTVPGIGPKLAKQIHDELHVDTLEALEVMAYDGRLETVPGIGKRRVRAIQAGIAALLGRVRAPGRRTSRLPPVDVLLAIDRDYRERAEADSLPKIAPKRFNPKQEAWLPIQHTERDGWHFTALFSNTARAHELGRTHDWVVIYFYDDDHREGQCTIVTETHGPLRGRRVIRGRENEQM